MGDKPPDERELLERLKNQRADDVTEAEAEVLLELWDKKICPASRSAKARSAVVSVSTPGVLVTGMRRIVQAATSILS